MTEAKGFPGQQLSLHLLLRVVADVGIVGFPNAGAFVAATLGLGFPNHLCLNVSILGECVNLSQRFPNPMPLGKSSLLAALTNASPEVASYPFTTLMPNLGVLAQPSASTATSDYTSLYHLRRSRASPVLADLPGLIEGNSYHVTSRSLIQTQASTRIK